MEKGCRLDDADSIPFDKPTTFHRTRTHTPVHRYQPLLMEYRNCFSHRPEGAGAPPGRRPKYLKNITSESKIIRQTRLLHPLPVKDSKLGIMVLAIPQELAFLSGFGSARGGILLLLPGYSAAVGVCLKLGGSHNIQKGFQITTMEHSL
ncbi:uncharacterized protein LOC129742520 [Uranotaenia lowii]|uniref:uncharacterized protein LOC129742520 n=1 Tax=Uranotaenia lowii TaxID=190385 RepID=UPI0024788FCA|nr:uncharacterized protein LOC129742520 [Uranotaenia lowii]